MPFDGDGKGKKGKGERKGLSCLANKEKGEEGMAEARKQGVMLGRRIKTFRKV